MQRRRFIKTAALGTAALGLGAAWPGSARAGEIVRPPLPYAQDALAPYISARTVSFHYGKHHLGYVKKTNAAIKGTPWAGKSLEQIILGAYGKDDYLFNNAAQVWNHNFYWQSLKPGGGGEPTGKLAAMMKAGFGSVDQAKQALVKAAATRFGSGWGWLALKDGKLVAVSSSNALNPMVDGMKPVITIDVWEHAYYLDYQNRRGDYIKGIMGHLINWDFAAKNLAS
ncbi:MAG: twin-arginine translocation signal domain-containing protein [Desulfarculaceae bacterium]|nr:twin-arginine translocation signal domain-containing protein [Desulfarculaceae bacterium]MCF8074103.1 twin-arginine translocation signal domain-containing protein [Desulfarculaceae bacterium]MCF8116837.1 twin-arginine translocation signal domain-containing protein [Desulfarculaceae bacterium]